MTDRAHPKAAVAAAFGIALSPAAPAADADAGCASPAQATEIRSFYRENPGTLPAIAARRLQLPEVLVASGLPPELAASAPPAAFADIWAAMTEWSDAVFLILKGADVFEIQSPVATGKPSTQSQYFNLDYGHPFRGHLRPDLYRAIYAIALPRADDEGTIRGVLFYDADGASVFGVMHSGEGPAPPPSEVAKFDAVMTLVRAQPQLCAGASAARGVP